MGDSEKYLLRSLMFVPAQNEKLLNKASTCEADVLLLDIEDSVQPGENKAIARSNIKKYIAAGKFKNSIVFPRINDRESGHLLKDLTELTIEGVSGFMCPKSCKGEDVYFIDKLLEAIEYEKGFSVGTFKLIPLIETTSAVLNAHDICTASKRVIAIAFGCEDYIADLQGIHDAAGQSIQTARAMIAMAARASGVIPIDTVHIKVHDLVDLEKNLIYAKNLGYEGMLVLNPKELPLVHQYFTPTHEEIQNAEAMLALAKQAEEEGCGVAMIGSKFIGPPMVKAAIKTLAKSRLAKSRASRAA